MKTNEDQTDKQLRKRRDLWIGIALFAIGGVYVFGIVSEGRDLQATMFSIVGLVAGVLALVHGKKLGDHRAETQWVKDTNAVSPVIAVILMVAITVVLAATVFVLVADIGTNQPAPSVSFTVDSVADTLTVSSVSTNALTWGELRVDGCDAPDGNSTVDAGDVMRECSGQVTVVHINSNTMIYTARFD